MKVLVIGTGAREHALVRAIAADPQVDRLLVAPGNPGMAGLAELRPVNPLDPEAVTRLAVAEQVDLVIVGPEAPLVAGVADALRSAGIAVFGPDAAAAALEGSKAFAKQIMAEAGVPTSMAHVCTTVEEVAEAIDAFGPPFVVKDDGLAAGKGVVVTSDREAALAHGAACLGKEGGVVVVEEYLDGPEVSLFCLSDGRTVIPLEPAQDFKRLGDGDLGPNTGGMGAYSPLPWAPDRLVADVLARVAQPTVDTMAHRGVPFIGVLYCGLALTSRGVRVIEFNARFGDPETQVVLARLATPLGQLLYAAATGRLDQAPALRWRPDAAVTVVIAAENYPEAPVTGDEITGLDAAEATGAWVLHAGTAPTSAMMGDALADVAATDGAEAGSATVKVVSAGGRVLSVVALGATLDDARATAYAGVSAIGLRGSQHRTDIAAAAAAGAVTVPAGL